MKLAALFGVGALCCAFTVTPVHAQTALPGGSQIVYDNALENGWVSYGWATLNYSNPSPTHSGADSISVAAGGYQALYVHHDPFDASAFTSLTFWINGGASGGQSLQIQGTINGNAQAAFALPAPTANTWTQVTATLASLGTAGSDDMDGFWIQNKSDATAPTFYIDDIALIAVPPPATIELTADATNVVRQLDGRIFGVNTAIWDSQLGSTATRSLLSGVKVGSLRYPGGSSSDDYDWQVDRSVTDNSFTWSSPFPVLAAQAEALGAQPFITVNYGSGTPQEAAAWVAYANGSPSNTLALGTDSKGRDWQTAGYWASLRAAAPLATDDGYNFLRVSHPAAWGFRTWEIGNECYGGWEHDEHGTTFTGAPQDPYTYAQFFAQFRAQMLAVDPTIQIGAVVIGGQDSYGNGQHAVTNPVDGTSHTGWTPVVLANLKSLDALPAFLTFHDYPEEPGQESDSGLLGIASTMAGNDSAGLRLMLTDYIGGSAGAAIYLALTEVNSVAYNPGKQSVSLVDGLFYAEMLGSLAGTEFDACTWWDLRNGSSAGNNNSDGLYGWREFGDYGLVASGDRSDTPLNTVYPSGRALELLTHWIAGGDRAIAATSNYQMITVHAALRANGDLCLLVINKDPANDLTAQIALDHFVPSSASAGMYQFGKTNDLENTDVTATKISGVGANFAQTFPSYSMTVIDLVKPAPAAPTTFAQWQNAHFTTAQLENPAISAAAADPDGDGISNLLEYALDLNPLIPSQAGLPVAGTTILNGEKYLSLTYTVVKADTDLTYVVEVSGDLVTWSSGSAYTVVHATVDHGATETITTRDKVALGSASRRFIRLRVLQNN